MLSFRPIFCHLDSATSTLRVEGSVDETSIDVFRRAVEDGSADFTRDLRVDLTDVDFLPSLAIGVLASAMTRARDAGHVILLVASRDTIAARVLGLTGVPYVVPDEADAVPPDPSAAAQQGG